MAERYWLETLGCPKNQVDSEKLSGTLSEGGYQPAASPEEADLVVVNTCAFIEAARQESIDTILTLDDARRTGSRLVVTGCMAERYGDELASSLPEVDLVAPFGVQLAPPAASSPVAGKDRPVGTPVALTKKAEAPSFDLLNLPRQPATAPWAYIKVAEGCDRNCGFCAIPSFRGKQRSRPHEAILAEAEQLGARDGVVREIVLVAQDLASYGLDRSSGSSVPRPEGPAVGSKRPIVDLVRALSERVERTRLLYLYPSSLDDSLIE
ncbi:MAG TPA: radical SAM protein, partial [Acidimicrobiales bacterium]|nr:radical SAM protein [Acidimicrobiales bacterium]